MEINIDPRDNHSKAVTYPTPIEGGVQERGDKKEFDFHVDSSFSAFPPAYFALGCGQGHNKAKTIYADTDKLLKGLTSEEISILKQPIFQHYSGISSTSEHFRIAPVLQKDKNGLLHFRGNFESNRLRVEANARNVVKAQTALNKLRELCKKPENNFEFALKENDVVIAPNIFHSRNSYRDNTAPEKNVLYVGLLAEFWPETTLMSRKN